MMNTSTRVLESTYMVKALRDTTAKLVEGEESFRSLRQLSSLLVLFYLALVYTELKPGSCNSLLKLYQVLTQKTN